MTSDGGLILVRELRYRLGLSELIEWYLADPRRKNVQIPTYCGRMRPVGNGKQLERRRQRALTPLKEGRAPGPLLSPSTGYVLHESMIRPYRPNGL